MNDSAFSFIEKISTTSNQTRMLEPALKLLVHQGYLPPVVSIFEQKTPFNIQDAEGNTALHIAVLEGHFTAVKEFIKERIGRGIDQPNHFCDTALSLAIQHERYDIANFLLTKGADHRVINSGGKSLLRIAVEKGSVALARLLLRVGADPNTQSFNRTPLYMARFHRALSRKQSAALVRTLLFNGADVSALPVEEILRDVREDTKTYLLYLAYGWNPERTHQNWLNLLRTHSLKTYVKTGRHRLYEYVSFMLSAEHLIDKNDYLYEVLPEVLRWLSYAEHNREPQNIQLEQAMLKKLKRAFEPPDSKLRTFTKIRSTHLAEVVKPSFKKCQN